MRPFILFAVTAILFVLIIGSFFFDPAGCLENGFGCPEETGPSKLADDFAADGSGSLTIADRILDPAQCPFFNRTAGSKVFEFDPLRKRTLKPTKMEDLKDIAHLSLHLSLSLAIDASNRATLPEPLAAQFEGMSTCQLCDWAVFANRPSVLDTIQSRKVLAYHVEEVAAKRLREKGVEFEQCGQILAKELRAWGGKR